MSKLVTIYGGSGFVGRHIAQRIAQHGWRVRVAVRRPNEALFVRPYGVVGQVEPVLCNIRNAASVRAAMQGADAVVNCVGILNGVGKNSFDAVQAKGAGTIARAAAELGVRHLAHISAIGADAKSDSAYARSKAAGEAAVLAAFPAAVILRPSVIFGNGDSFFNRFAAMTRYGPFLPVVGGATLFQPVHVEDVAQAAVQGVLGQAAGVYELGGPDVASLTDLMQQMLAVVQRHQLVMDIPFFVARIMAFAFDMVQKLSLQLITNQVLTRDQVRNLAHDNVVAPGAKGFADLGIVPASIAAVLPEYLWTNRQAGQFAAIKNASKTLRKV